MELDLIKRFFFFIQENSEQFHLLNGFYSSKYGEKRIKKLDDFIYINLESNTERILNLFLEATQNIYLQYSLVDNKRQQLVLFCNVAK